MSVIVPNKEEFNQIIVDYFAGKLKGQKPRNVPEDDQIVLVHSSSMVALHLAVFIKKKYIPYITNVGSDFLPLGFGQMLGSKGAISVNFDLGGMRMLFINCHLDAHAYAFEKRNK